MIWTNPKTELENYFAAFRSGIVGRNQTFDSPFGSKKIVYADWTASGRAYQPIEEYLQHEIMPFIANTHTEATVTGTLMSKAYEEAKAIIKKHVNASKEDILIFCGSGMTAAVNKLQRILGIRIPERMSDYIKEDKASFPQFNEELKPIVFITHMEHHSNQLSWLETIADVEIIRCGKDGNADLEYFGYLLETFKHRKNKIAAVTACSNVTGIQTPYHDIAKMIHDYEGLCFVDFACSAPYVNMDMHPASWNAHLDAVYFSMHKFLGGPGTPGVLVFNKKMYTNKIPDQPGGGTVLYSNPWKDRDYLNSIEQREDGGTPPFLQGIKAGMCIRLKEAMGIKNILKREEEILEMVFDRFSQMENIEMLEGKIKRRLGIVSFIIKGAHYNLVVKLLNDKFGIQARGGCSCAGTYGHLLLNADEERSYKIRDALLSEDMKDKPGWVRLSVHPTMTNAEVEFIMNAIEQTASSFQLWMKDYTYDPRSNEFSFNQREANVYNRIEDWFDIVCWDK